MQTHLMGHEDLQRSDIREEPHLHPMATLSIPQPSVRCIRRMVRITHLVHIAHNPVHDLPLKWLEHDGAVSRYELRLSTSWHDHALPNVEYRDDRNDISKLARASSLYVGVELGLQEVEHPRPKVGRV